MAGECPECGNLVSASAGSCKQCGADLGDRPATPIARPRQMEDSVKYTIIIGAILAAALILYLVSGGMGMSSPCVDCSGRGVIVCSNCKGGEERPRCATCRGSGRDPQNFSTCQSCGGKGSVATCPKCKGSPKKRCPTCEGSGKLVK